MGLIVLLVMSIMGVTGMNIASMEEKMAANARNRDLAFQAADSALRAGESCIMTQIEPPTSPETFSCNTLAPGKGYHDKNVPLTWNPLTAGAVWNDPEETVQFTGSLAQIGTRPSYVVERSEDCETTELPCPKSKTWQTYRITAHASGGTPDAVAIVQSTVRRK